MRISNSGEMRYCRWADYSKPALTANIAVTKPIEYFQQNMASLRQTLAQGAMPAGCHGCYQADRFNKVSGRQRQLLKTGIQLDNFDRTLRSSPWIKEFTQAETNGVTEITPQDWQIDLGNYCNSNCIFCSPSESSRLATEFRRLNLISDMPPANWSDDPQLVSAVQVALLTSRPKFIHFVGGETIITPAFKKILLTLLSAGGNTTTISFTTNLTVWDQEIVDLLSEFQEINIGMSVETFDQVNDYVRWPSKIDQIRANLDRWVAHGKTQGWLQTLRITPTCLTVHGLVDIYQYAIDHNLNVESVNFLERPAFLRPTVLPLEVRSSIVKKLSTWIETHSVPEGLIVNVRNPEFQQKAAIQDAKSYVQYLSTVGSEIDLLPELVQYLKRLESNRHNSILDYLPEYEHIFKSAGY